MASLLLSRRALVLGGLSALPGCSAVSALNDVSRPLPTFDLRPVSGDTSGPRSRATFLVTDPVSPAVLATDRILVRATPATISYLPDARWSDDLPTLLQSLIIRSLSLTGRVGYVDPPGEGPVPDFALLGRLDTFDVVDISETAQAEAFVARVSLNMTVLRDDTQRVIATRTFDGSAAVPDISPLSIVSTFQSLLDAILPALTSWVIATGR